MGIVYSVYGTSSNYGISIQHNPWNRFNLLKCTIWDLTFPHNLITNSNYGIGTAQSLE